MPNDTFTPEEQSLIARLKAAPQPQLKPQVLDTIRAELFLEMDKAGLPFWQTKIGITSITVVTAIIVIILVVVGASVLGNDPESPTTAPKPSSTPSVETITPTMESSITPANSPTETIEITPRLASPTPQPTATTSSTSGGAPILVIEGPVTAININTITIFDMDIQVDPTDPILTQLQIGDQVRIDGQTTVDGNTIIIVAVNITIINIQIIVEPSGGLPANCKMTKNGKITCKDTRRTTRD